MINHKLALAVKKAGFLVKLVIGAEEEEWDGRKVFFDGDMTKEGGKIGFLAPTLEELIEACGENFRLQNSKPGLWQADTCGDFNEWDKERHVFATGKTSLIAVANLFLKLNENKQNN